MQPQILITLTVLLVIVTSAPLWADDAARLAALAEEVSVYRREQEERRSQLMQMQEQLRPGKSAAVLRPRSQASVLAGSEIVISLESWRQMQLSQGDPYRGARTAAEVTKTYEEGPSPAEKLAFAKLDWSDLHWNWATAVLLGDLDEAYRLQMESTSVTEYMFEYLKYSRFQLTSGDGPFFAGLVHTRASLIGLRLSTLPDKWDPEGFIRQKLRFAHDELMRVADTIIASSAF